MFETMEKLIAGFPADLRHSAGKLDSLNIALKPFNRVLVSGLGGSGIGGTLVSECLAGESTVPILVNKDYRIPEWVNNQTLFVACSYSGNTEETLSATAEAVEKGAQIAVITSGGKLKALAAQDNWPVIELVPGYPPRAAFGHSAVSLFGLMHAAGLYPGFNTSGFLKIADFLEANSESIKMRARSLAELLNHRVPVIYSASGMEAVAVRWRQQINENAKMLCWHHVLPEMNHNELVGWAGGDQRFALVLLRSADDHPRTAMRMNLCKEIIGKKTDVLEEIYAEGNTSLERKYFMIHLGDWLSLYLSQLKGVDPVEVDVISYLKNELARR